VGGGRLADRNHKCVSISSYSPAAAFSLEKGRQQEREKMKTKEEKKGL